LGSLFPDFGFAEWIDRIDPVLGLHAVLLVFAARTCLSAASAVK
jgi:hypothetical protein